MARPGIICHYCGRPGGVGHFCQEMSAAATSRREYVNLNSVGSNPVEANKRFEYRGRISGTEALNPKNYKANAKLKSVRISYVNPNSLYVNFIEDPDAPISIDPANKRVSVDIEADAQLYWDEMDEYRNEIRRNVRIHSAPKEGDIPGRVREKFIDIDPVSEAAAGKQRGVGLYDDMTDFINRYGAEFNQIELKNAVLHYSVGNKEFFEKNIPNIEYSRMTEIINRMTGIVRNAGFDISGDDKLAVLEYFDKIQNSFASPLEGIISGPLDNQYVSQYGIGAGKIQHMQEMGVLPRISSDAMLYGTSSGKGGMAIPMTGSWWKEDIIRAKQYYERTGKVLDHFQAYDPNNMSAEETEAFFKRWNIDNIGIGSWYQGWQRRELRGTKIGDRFYGEFIQDLKQREADILADFIFPKQMNILDTESQYYAAKFREEGFTSAAEFKRATIRSAHEYARKDLASMAGDDVAIRKYIEEELLGGRSGKASRIILTEAYQEAFDLSKLVSSAPTGNAIIAGRSEFRLTAGNYRRTIDDWVDWMQEAERRHMAGMKITGLNVGGEFGYDIPQMRFMTETAKEYYRVAGVDESDPRYKYTVGALGDSGIFNTLENTLNQHFDITKLMRRFSILTSGGRYLGYTTPEELDLMRSYTSRGYTSDAASEIIMHKRAQRIARQYLGDPSVRLTNERITDILQPGSAKWEQYVAHLGDITPEEAALRLPTDDVLESNIRSFILEMRESELSDIIDSSGSEFTPRASADLARMQLLPYLEREDVATDLMKKLNIGSREEFLDLIFRAHNAEQDVKFTAVLMNELHRRLTQERQVVVSHIDQKAPDFAIDFALQDIRAQVAEYGKAESLPTLAPKGAESLIVVKEGTSESVQKHLAKMYTGFERRLIDKERGVGMLEDFIEKVEEGDFVDAIKSVGTRIDEAEARILTNNSLRVMDMFKIKDYDKALDLTKKMQRGGALAVVGLIGTAIVGSKLKEKLTDYDAWKETDTENIDYYLYEQEKKKNALERTSFGDLTLEGSRRRNYSYNMRPDRHDHLF